MFYHHTCKVNKDLKNPILDVIFTGGNTMIKSFDKKFQLEFKHICEHFDRGVLRAEKYAAKHADTRFQANKYAAWAGCSMLFVGCWLDFQCFSWGFGWIFNKAERSQGF